MMTRPYLGYVIHYVTLISIFFRLPFPIKNYNNTPGKNAPWGLGAQYS